MPKNAKKTSQFPHPLASADRFQTRLRQRDALMRQIRDFFAARGFLEVHPPCLSRDCVVDAFLDPIRIPSTQIAACTNDRYLQTSPESAMKRMLVKLAASTKGTPSIYAITPVFRQGESGPLHNLEFTMLEWYEVDGTADTAIKMLGELASITLATKSYEVVSYQDAFQTHLNIHPVECSLAELQRQVLNVDASLGESLAADRDGMLDVLLSEHIQPQLGTQQPTILTRYPITQAALAKRCDDDPRYAERFELYFQGVELANGYDELLDADELLQRMRANNAIRIAHGREPLATETTLLAAMRQGLPQCSGVAVGLDRLLMIQVGASNLQDVLAFSFDEA